MQDGKKRTHRAGGGGAPLQKEQEYVVALSGGAGGRGAEAAAPRDLFGTMRFLCSGGSCRTEGRNGAANREAVALASVNLDCIHSPFRYAGGKYYARKLITEHIAPHTAYCGAVCGGAPLFSISRRWR